MTRPAKILHVIDSFDLGGAQEALVNLVACCDRERFAPEVASMHGRGVYWSRFTALGVPVHSLSPHKFLPLYVVHLLRLLLTRRYDVVHCHLIASNLVAKPLAALLGVRVRFNHDQTNDEYRYKNKARLWLDLLSNRLSTHVCAVSASIRDFLSTHEGVPQDRVSLIYNAIDLARFTPHAVRDPKARALWDLPAQARIIAGVGRLNYQKNFSLFLEIAADVARTHPDTCFVLAGSGPEESALKRKAEALLPRDRVRFLGFVADTSQLYRAVDILLMPSRFEGLPMTLLEAMAMQVPTVASRLDGIAEVVTDGIDGLLAEPDDRDGFAAKVRLLLDDSARAAQIAEAARALVSSRFAAERMTREVEALYEKYLGNQ